MAVAHDASTTASVSSGNTSLTWGHTCTGSNLVFVVGIWVDSTSSDIVTGVTYNGVALTRATVKTQATFIQYQYILAGPATGTHNVVVSFSGTASLVCGADSYVGGNQTGQPDATNTGAVGVGSTLISVAVTTVADNCWLVGQYGNNGGTSSAGSNTFQRQTEGSANRCVYDTNGAQTPPGSFSLNVNVSSSPQNSILNVLAIKPFVNAVSRTMSDSIMNSVSRSASLTYGQVLGRAMSASIMNSASRLASVGVGYARNLTASIMNSASRFATVSGLRSFFRTVSASIMNSVSRFATVSRLAVYGRSMADSVMNAASRVAAVARTRTFLRTMSDSMMNARGRLTSVIAFVDNVLIQWTDKFKKQNTSYSDKHRSQGTVWEDKYHP